MNPTALTEEFRNEIDCLRDLAHDDMAPVSVDLLRAAADGLEALLGALRPALDALAYYGSPETYFGIAMLGDPPHGDFFDDFEKHPIPGNYAIQDKPGRRARDVLRNLDPEFVAGVMS